MDNRRRVAAKPRESAWRRLVESAEKLGYEIITSHEEFLGIIVSV